MATATIYLYENPTQNYSISCWADRQFSRDTSIVRKTVDSSNPQTAATMVTAGTITPGSLTSMPSSNVQNLVFSYANLSQYKVNITAATLYVTLASDTTFDGINVGSSYYSYPIYDTEYSGSVDLSGVNTTEKTITATLSIDPSLSSSVLNALGGGYSWAILKEATPSSDVYYYSDEIDDVYYYYYYRYYLNDTGIQRSWCSAKVTNVYLVITYEEDTSVIIDRSTAISMINVGVSNVAKRINNMFVGINGVAKKISEAWIGINGVAKKIYPAYLVSMLNPGDTIQIDEEGTGTTFVDWIVMHHDYYGTGQTILMRKYCLSTERQLNYNGGNSSIYGYPYFNGTADNYLKDTWLTARPESFQDLLIETTIAGRTWSGGTVKTAARKVWLPAAVNLSQVSFPLGTETAYDDDPSGAFAYFLENDTNANRIAYDENGTAQVWWTRTTTGGTHPYCRRINTSGGFNNVEYYYSGYLRPVINVYSNNYLEKISDGVYRMIGGGKPTGVVLISFTIDGITYQTEEGMTWTKWVESSYNTGGFFINGDRITDPITYDSVYLSTTYVSSGSIVAEHTGMQYSLHSGADEPA